MSQNIKFWLNMREHFDVHYAAIAFEEYTGIELKLSHGFNWGGWHGRPSENWPSGSDSNDQYSLEIFMNPHNVGHRPEYHRPEHKDALVVVLFYCSDTAFRKFEADLAHKPGIFMLNTGFEKNVPLDHSFQVLEKVD